MNIAARASTIAEIGTTSGITIANMAGVAEANAEIKTLAGYLAISIPFICIAVVKGVGTFVHLAGQMTGATTSAAGAAAGEIAGGNMSYGNVSLGNSQMGNASQLQRNMNSLIASGGHRRDTGGVQITQDAGGWSATNYMQDTGPRNFSGAFSDVTAQQEAIRNMESEQHSFATRFSNAKSTSESLTGRIYEQVSNTKADDMALNYNVSTQQAQSWAESAKYMDAHSKGKAYNSSTNAQGGLRLGGSIDAGTSAGTSTNTGLGETSGAESKLKGLSAKLSFGADAGTSVQANNSRLYGSNAQATEDETYNHHKSIMENAMQSIAKSDRNDELTSLARERGSSLHEANSLATDMARTESAITQAEKSMQNSVTNTISSNETLISDFVDIARAQNPDMSENQAKELFFHGNRSDPTRKAAEKWVMQNNAREAGVYLRKPNVETGNLNFGNEDLKEKYETKESAVQMDINEKGETMAQQKALNRQKRGGVEQRVTEKIRVTSGEISKGKGEINAKGEQIKQGVKKFGDKNLLSRNLKEAKNAINPWHKNSDDE